MYTDNSHVRPLSRRSRSSWSLCYSLSVPLVTNSCSPKAPLVLNPERDDSQAVTPWVDSIAVFSLYWPESIDIISHTHWQEPWLYLLGTVVIMMKILIGLMKTYVVLVNSASENLPALTPYLYFGSRWVYSDDPMLKRILSLMHRPLSNHERCVARVDGSILHLFMVLHACSSICYTDLVQTVPMQHWVWDSR